MSSKIGQSRAKVTADLGDDFNAALDQPLHLRTASKDSSGTSAITSRMRSIASMMSTGRGDVDSTVLRTRETPSLRYVSAELGGGSPAS